MDYFRQTVDSEMLSGFLNLPDSMRKKRVEVIILSDDGDEPQRQISGEAYGALRQYANPGLFPLEKGAWERAVKKKYENS